MNNVKDITGQRFGRLVVKEMAYKKNGFDYWLCMCDCSKEKIIRGWSLRKGITQSCGCLQRDKVLSANLKEISGEKFGRLTAIRFIRKKGSNTYWEFECECGKKIIAQKTAVMSGFTNSCGCIQKEKAKAHLIEANEGINWVENTDLSRLNDIPQKNNTSGIKGVNWDKSRSKWRAFITFQGKHIYLGRYDTIKEASKARKLAEEKYFQPILERYGKTNE